MKIQTIIDYDPFLGGLSAGIEDGKNFVVKKNLALNKKNDSIYRSNHLLGLDYTPEPVDYHIDVFTAVPDLGDWIDRRGVNNFNLTQLYECLGYISLHQPDRVVIAVFQPAITYLQIAERVVYFNGDLPTIDLIIDYLDKIGYTVRNDVIDIATYRIPQHKIISFYVGTKKSLLSEGKMKNFRFPGSDNKKEVSTEEWLSTLKQRRGGKFHRPNFKWASLCSKVPPGKGALDIDDFPITKGYIRIDPKKAAPMIGPDYYKISSNYPCIHPTEDRPLTVIEGALLSGFFSNYYNFDQKLSKKDAANMVFKSVSPMIGEYVRRGLLKMTE